MEEGKSQTSQVLKENSDISDFTCYQIDQFVQTQVYLTFFNQCYLANVMVLKFEMLSLHVVTSAVTDRLTGQNETFIFSK